MLHFNLICNLTTRKTYNASKNSSIRLFSVGEKSNRFIQKKNILLLSSPIVGVSARIFYIAVDCEY